ncbi:MAG: hypothetical protein HZA51_05330 [Planctomycetes bacterium]|nr:hypothetical protein [Planctomycetota bacterium]
MNLFHLGLFAKSLAVIGSVAVVGCAVALRVQGELATRDIVGTVISVPMLAYLVHLWIALSKEEASR